MRAFPRIAALVLMAALSSPARATGQSAAERASFCVAGGGFAADCAAAAVSVQQVVAQVGLMAGPGGEIPGEGSALGRRLGGVPRIAAWLRGGIQPFGVPDPSDPNGSSELSPWTPTLQVGVGVGVFDGFQVRPTVGGFLSLDLLASASFVFLSEDARFEKRVDLFSFGARVGLLRESFTLPGVTVSVARRLSGVAHLGDTAAGDRIEVFADPSVTSLRVTASKDLFAFGILAGIGWDYASAATRMVVPSALGGALLSGGPIEVDRRLYFASVSRQLGILAWLTLEGGWARGFERLVSYRGTGFDPGDGALFGSLSVLLKL